MNQIAGYAVPRETKFIALVVAFLITFSFVDFRAASDFNGNRLLTADRRPSRHIVETDCGRKRRAEQNEDPELQELLKELRSGHWN